VEIIPVSQAVRVKLVRGIERCIGGKCRLLEHERAIEPARRIERKRREEQAEMVPIAEVVQQSNPIKPRRVGRQIFRQ